MLRTQLLRTSRSIPIRPSMTSRFIGDQAGIPPSPPPPRELIPKAHKQKLTGVVQEPLEPRGLAVLILAIPSTREKRLRRIWYLPLGPAHLVLWHMLIEKYMKQREAEKLKALRKMLEEQRQHIDEIEKHINKMETENGTKK